MSTKNPLPFSNQFERGHSFNWAGEWMVGKYYLNDQYVTDFVRYENAILACRKNHKSTKELEPTLLYRGGKVADVDSPYWELVYAFLDSNPAGIYNVEYNENTGLIRITYSDGRYDEFALNIKISDTSIWTGDTPPDNENKLWIDTSNSGYSSNNDNLASIRQAVYTLQRQMQILLNIRYQGAVSGKISDGFRTEMTDAAAPEAPASIEDILDDGIVEIKPSYADNSEPTVNHISIKMGTWDQLDSNRRNFISGELIWCTDRNRLYIYINGSLIPAGSGSGSSSEDDSMTDDRVIELIGSELENVDSIGFVPVGSTTEKYIVKVDSSGNLICYNNDLDTKNQLSSANYQMSSYNDKDLVAATGLVISSFYTGGDADEHSYLPCSHNFVELANVAKDSSGNPIDINLNGYYLCYWDGTQWFKLPLWGTIKSGGTFLVRGAQCAVMDVNTTKIKVRSYDMEWTYVENGKIKPIRFKVITGGNSEGFSFYVGWGDDNGRLYDINGVLTDSPAQLVKLADNNVSEVAKGYIDLCGVGTVAKELCEKSAYSLQNGVKSSDVLFRRWYILDPVTQSNPASLDKHNNKKYMSCSYLTGGNFDPEIGVEGLTPKASWEGKTIAAARTLFAEDYPSTLTCSFGIQATYKDSTHPATRTFCWNSVGYYDEGIKYRAVNTTDWTYVESMKDGNTEDSDWKEYYVRKRWESSYGQPITTHKVIVKGLTAGTYEYRVYRIGDENYASGMETRKFTVVTDSTINNGFIFAQTTDQQGANWEEYELWVLSALKMKAEIGKNFSDFNFIINTGDICYNGSRSNEWIDYFNGYLPFKDKEEMLTVGNNDLAPISMQDIGTGKETPWKINVNVIDYFYCIEIDPDNPQVFYGVPADESSENATKKYYIPSLYSFNYGKWHFVSLISEIRTISNKNDNGSAKAMKQTTVNTIFGIKDELRTNDDGTENPHASKIFDTVERWLICDLLKWKGVNISSIKGTEFDLNDYRFNTNLVDKCSKCIIYTHEMPFNIVSSSAYSGYESTGGKNVPRETAKAYLNRYHDFEFQRSFKVWGIRMVIGGHKHTAAMTKPVYDAPDGFNPYTSQPKDLFTFAAGENCFSNAASFRPFVQITYDDFSNGQSDFGYIKLGNNVAEVYNNSSKSITIGNKTYNRGDVIEYSVDYPRARVEIVDSITAPSYIMCHATGFKNKSNSDLACNTEDGSIPWELHYIPGDDNSVGAQYYPFFTIYTIDSEDNIKVDMYKIEGFYSGGGAGYWDLAKAYTDQTVSENRTRLVNKAKLISFSNEPVIIKTS